LAFRSRYSVVWRLNCLGHDAPLGRGLYLGGWSPGTDRNIRSHPSSVGFSTITSGFEFSADTGTNDINGGFAGGTIGYNWQGAGSPFVVGIEVDAAWSDIKYSESFLGAWRNRRKSPRAVSSSPPTRRRS
jgi:hypothetical protein